jgi:glutamate/tyrosine decarboxylase-like PLP-dependent enzyme
MRRLGYRTVDMLVDQMTAVPDGPALRRASPAEMHSRIPVGPDGPRDFETLLAELERDVFPFMSRCEHPGYFAFIPAAGTFPGALGDFIASATNVYAGSWQESAGPTQLELELLSWFKRWIGYPDEAAGSLGTGGSAANLTAIACAREAVVGSMRDDLVIYLSDQTHSSIARGARVLGFRPEQLRVLPVDDDLRLEPAVLKAALAADERAGRRPFLVIANAGATSTGAVDPIGDLAAVCAERSLWLHVDAAYGGFAVLTERGRAQLGDLARADSITLDPHKWLYQPYECGCLLVRDGRALRHAFAITSDYLRDAEVADDEVNFSDYGLQLTRTSRAFKLWLSLATFGVDAFRAAIDRTLDLAELASERIGASEVLELVAPPSLGIVCFRHRERHTDGLVAALEESGLGLISSTRVHGRSALRLCILSHTTAAADVERVLSFLETAEPVEAGPEYDPHVAVRASTPLFARLEQAEHAALAEVAVARRASAGEHLVERWDQTREFYVLDEGAVDIVVDGEVVKTLRAGDYFGEIGALEWGAGFARSRVASVVAREDVCVRVLDAHALAGLLDRFPRLEREIRHTAHERMRETR